MLRVDEARVMKAGVQAASLRRHEGQCTFAYAPDYQGPAVAWSLPRTSSPVVVAGGAVPPFFAGLLPEGRRLQALRRAVKTSADDDFSLLLAVGHDPIGNVTVVPADGTSTPAPRIQPADLTTTTFEAIYATVLSPDPSDRVGLPGVQSKLSGGMISMPLDWGGRPSILKLNPLEFPGVVRNEACMLALAAKAGLRVPAHRVVVDAAGEEGLLIARFDRVQDAEGAWRARAQEDACQVLGLYPADKYRASTEDVLAGLASCCDAPLVAARELFRMVVFAYLTCNGDAHAKNFSVLQDDRGEWRASPAYDLPTTHPYGDTTMALAIGGRKQEDIGRTHLLELAQAVGLPRRAAERVVDETVAAVGANLAMFDALPFDERRLHMLKRAVAFRMERAGG